MFYTENFFLIFRLLIKYLRDEKIVCFHFLPHKMSFIDQKKEFMNEMNICDIVEKHKFMLMSSYFEALVILDYNFDYIE